jgi:hypothetical protein
MEKILIKSSSLVILTPCLINYTEKHTITYLMYAAVTLISEFKTDDPTFAILNTITLGLATRKTISDAYNVALACDPTSAFGGVLIKHKNRCCNR